MASKLSTLILFLLFLSCSKETVQVYNKLDTFDDLHSSVQRYSASIESRKINWDSIGNIYRPLISNDLSEEAYFEILAEMLRTFRDPHVWLISNEKSMFTIDYLEYTRNYDLDLIQTKYIPDLESHSAAISSGFIQDSIAYLRCLDFKGDIDFNNQIYQTVFTKFASAKGLIIDLRANDGGNVYNTQNLLNKLSENRLLWHTSQNRTLEGFDEKYEWYIEPDPQILFNQKVILLTGRFTISAGERFAMGAKLLDNITIVGDSTANTQGSVMGREMKNGWKYTMTFEKCLSPDGVNYAGQGIPPDIYISSEDAIQNQRDSILELALKLLN